MKINTIVFSALLMCRISIVLHAQNPVAQIGGRALGVSGASVCFTDVWAQYHNQAALAGIKGTQIGFGFQNEFMVKELSTKSLAFAIPITTGTIGLNYYYFGYPKFNESKLGLAFASNLGKKIQAGIQLDYFYTHIEGEYGNRGIAAGEAGIIAEPINKLFIASHIFNIWNAGNKQSTYQLPTIFKVGAMYSFDEKALLSIEFEKDLIHSLVFKSGLEVKLIENFEFRLGFASCPDIFSFGFSYTLNSIRADLAFKRHPVLGFSQGISMLYSFSEKK
jgi:hypothetical protein